jgi:hypothetical protein
MNREIMNRGMIGKCHHSVMVPLRAAGDAPMMFDPRGTWSKKGMQERSDRGMDGEIVNGGTIGKCHPSMMLLRAARDAPMMFDPERNLEQERNAGIE